MTCFPEGTVVKNLPVNAGDSGGPGSILGSGRSPRKGELATHSSTLTWKIPWTGSLVGTVDGVTKSQT